MLHDLANDDGCVALKGTAEDREGWKHREIFFRNLQYSKLLMMIRWF